MLMMMFENAVSVARLVESHRALVAELSALEQLAHHLGGCPGTAALDNLAESVALLPVRLDEHMAREERDVYPNLVARLGSLEVQSMLADHQEIRRWIDKLFRAHSRLDRCAPDLGPVRWTLYVVIGLVSLHLRKEELAYMRLQTQQVEPA